MLHVRAARDNPKSPQVKTNVEKKSAGRSGYLLPVFPLTSLVYSQTNGVFTGNVVDKTGSVISGATVRVTSQATGSTREAKTDDTGHYLVPLLPVSVYTIRVESQGFQTTEQKDIRLQVDEQREIDFTLNPASVSSTVEVTATEVAVETTNPTLGQVITARAGCRPTFEWTQLCAVGDADAGHHAADQPEQLLHAGGEQ